MKQFLRYQISGMVFILWIFVFYYSGISDTSDEFINNIQDSIVLNKIVGGFIFAIPFGVIIHQISVTIKNYITVEICKEFDDFPNNYYKIFKDDGEYTKYILDRISNLNSFYYVRFDNGFLAPFLALIVVICFGKNVSGIAISVFLFLSMILLSYLPRICTELKEYNSFIK
jgi:hypothetical protein